MTLIGDTLTLQAHTTTDIISVSTITNKYSLLLRSLLHIEDTIWFGGAIDGGGNSLLPVIGKAPSGSLGVDSMSQASPTGGDIHNYAIDILYSSNDPTGMYLYGAGAERKNSDNWEDTNEKTFMLIIGRDQFATVSPWLFNKGCQSWTVVLV